MKFFLRQSSADSQKLPWTFVLIGICAFVLAAVACSHAFPSASIDLKFNRKEIESKAKQFALGRNFDFNKVHSATEFECQDTSKTFLEYKLGVKHADEVIKDTNCIYYWTTRFFRSMDKHDISVELAPDGSLRGFEESFPNDAVKTHVSHAQAQILAREFLRTEIGEDLSRFEIFAEKESENGQDTDHSFSWKRTDQTYAGGALGLIVGVRGDKVTQFVKYLIVPPGWDNEYKHLRSYNDTLMSAVQGIYYALYVVAVVVFLWSLHEGQLRWKLPIAAGMLVGVLAGLQELTALDSYLQDYKFTEPFSTYLDHRYWVIFLDALVYGVITFVLAGAAERVYRITYPRKFALESIASWNGIMSRSLAVSITAGHAVFGLALCWAVFYYLLGAQVGFYTPLQDHTDATISSQMPWISAVHVGTFASLHEEFLYRVICLSLVQRLVKNFWIANLIQAMAWAFMHSSYAQEPPWARGLELTVHGSFLGVVMRRYGLVACITSHYLYDAYLGVVPLFSSHSLVWRLDAVLAVAPFAAIASMGWLRGRKPLAAPLNSSLNAGTMQASAIPAETAVETATFSYVSLTWAHRLALALVTFVILFYAGKSSSRLLGEHLQITSNRPEVIAHSKDYLHRRQLDTAGSAISTELEKNFTKEQMEFLAHSLSRKQLEEFFQLPVRPMSWQVTFSSPERKNKYIVEVDHDGKPQAVELVVHKDSAGAQLSQREAQSRLDLFLHCEHPELVPYKIETVERTVQPHRTDYAFTITVPRFKAEETEYRTIIDVIGDQVSGFWYWWEVPDQFASISSVVEMRTKSTTYSWLPPLLLGMAICLFWLFDLGRKRLFVWRESAYLALILVIPLVFLKVNEFTTFFEKYDTDTPIATFVFRGLSGDLSYFVASYLGFFVLSVLALGAVNQLGYLIPLKEAWRAMFTQKSGQLKASRQLWTDALASGGCMACVVWGLSVLLNSNSGKSTIVQPLDRMCSLVNGLSVPLNTVATAVLAGLLTLVLSAVVCGVFATRTRRLCFIPLAIWMAYPYMQESGTVEPGVAIGVFVFFIFVYLTYKWIITELAKNNFLAYFIAGFDYVLLSDLRELSAHAQTQYSSEIVFLKILLVLPVIYIAYQWVRTLLFRDRLPLVIPASDPDDNQS